ncbi:MAG: carbohydrate binding domain-containing protein [Chloroflexota bacterium]
MFKLKRPFSAQTLFFACLPLLLILSMPVFARQQTFKLTSNSCGDAASNAISNHSFESGQSNWVFFTNGEGDFDVVSNDVYHCSNSARVTIDEAGTNVQLYQRGINLQPNSEYRLRFAAKSSSGRNARIILQKHEANYNNYGLNYVANLTTDWQEFEVDFTTSGFSGEEDNGRLRIWLAPYDKAGEVYYFDQIELTLLDGSPAPTATPDDPPAPTATPDDPGSTPTACDSNNGNILSNPSFESGKSNWTFFTSGSGSFNVTGADSYHCDDAAKITITSGGNNIQLFQAGINLQANTNYRLSFAAKSNSGNDLSVSAQNHKPNYEYYGLQNRVANLTSNWQTIEIDFTTSGFSGTADNARLRFWLAPYAESGDIYWIDNVVLEQLGSAPNPTNTPNPGPDPTNTPAPDPTEPPPPPSGSNQLEVFDWNGNVTEADRGFPWNQPPKENGDWTSPVNYAEGTLYVRAEIFSQPVPQDDMRLQFCFWQELNGNNFGLETCITTKNVPGTSGSVKCWSAPIESMWKLNGEPLDWDRPRYRVAAVIKNGEKLPVSNFNGWNWNGEDPKDWYPLNMRFTAIVVAKNSTFSGWGAYGGC